MGEEIKALCTQNRTSIKAIERELGFGNGSIRRWDTNAPSYDKIEKVAKHFNVSVSYLLGEQEKPTLSGELSDARKQLDAALDDMSDEELQFLMSKIKAIKEMRE